MPQTDKPFSNTDLMPKIIKHKIDKFKILSFRNCFFIIIFKTIYNWFMPRKINIKSEIKPPVR